MAAVNSLSAAGPQPGRLDSMVYGLGARNRSAPGLVPGIRQEKLASSKVDKDMRRRCLELLADPDLVVTAKQLFAAHDVDKSKTVDAGELHNMLRALHVELNMPVPDHAMVEQLIKRYDMDKDGGMTFAEFMELFKVELRRMAFDRSSIIRREFFITKSTKNVWHDYEKVKELGSGTFGTAYLTKRKVSGESRVVKAVRKSRIKLPLEDIEKEILIMRQVDHPHIVRMFEWYEDSGRVYLVLDLCQGGTLQEALLSSQKQQRVIKEAWIRR
jgi:hypothetical protein